MATKKIRLAIVDDHQLVIDGLLSLLSGYAHIEILHTSNEPRRLLEMMKADPPDILMTDVMMPGMNGEELAREVKKQLPSVKILALSMNGEGNLVNAMIEDSDIAGYVLKNIGQKELIHALDKIASGGIYFSEEVLQEMTRASERKKEKEEAHLTDREIEIIRLIEKEYSNKQIAETLFISERTVETHRKNIFRKTATNGVIGLIKYAYERKLI